MGKNATPSPANSGRVGWIPPVDGDDILSRAAARAVCPSCRHTPPGYIQYTIIIIIENSVVND